MVDGGGDRSEVFEAVRVWGRILRRHTDACAGAGKLNDAAESQKRLVRANRRYEAEAREWWNRFGRVADQARVILVEAGKAAPEARG